MNLNRKMMHPKGGASNMFHAIPTLVSQSDHMATEPCLSYVMSGQEGVREASAVADFNMGLAFELARKFQNR